MDPADANLLLEVLKSTDLAPIVVDACTSRTRIMASTASRTARDAVRLSTRSVTLRKVSLEPEELEDPEGEARRRPTMDLSFLLEFPALETLRVHHFSLKDAGGMATLTQLGPRLKHLEVKEVAHTLTMKTHARANPSHALTTALAACTALRTLRIHGMRNACQILHLKLPRLEELSLAAGTVCEPVTGALMGGYANAFAGLPALRCFTIDGRDGRYYAPEMVEPPFLSTMDGAVFDVALPLLEELTLQGHIGRHLHVGRRLHAVSAPRLKNLSLLHVEIYTVGGALPIPHDATRLESLKIERIGASAGIVPETFGRLTSLTKLSIGPVGGLRFEDLTALRPLVNLVDLQIARVSVRRIEGVEDLLALERLALRDTSTMHDGESNGIFDVALLTSLPRLKELDMSKWPNYENIEMLASLSALKRLELPDDDGRFPLAGVGELVGLTELTCDHHDFDNHRLARLAPLVHLESLTLKDGVYNFHLKAVEPFVNLRVLNLVLYCTEDESRHVSRPCNQQTHLECLSGLSQLEDLNLFGWWPKDLRPLAKLSKLLTLVLGCVHVDANPTLDALTSLTRLFHLGIAPGMVPPKPYQYDLPYPTDKRNAQLRVDFLRALPDLISLAIILPPEASIGEAAEVIGSLSGVAFLSVEKTLMQATKASGIAPGWKQTIFLDTGSLMSCDGWEA